jgi:hypothetical protein
MALVKPPKSIDRRAEELIDKAAAVHTSKRTNSDEGMEDVPVTVRIPKPMLDDIETFVKARPIKTARHTWLMEAIYEKWKREGGDQGR